MSLHQTELDRYASAFSSSAMLRHLGLVCSVAPDAVTITLPEARDEHRGGMGSQAINGGVMSAMYDFALGNTGILLAPLRRYATVQISLSFERAVRGRSARCVATLDRATSNMIFSSARILDEDGNVCSRATGVLALGREIGLDDWCAAIASHGRA
ncbi:MAG: PaaI family thioesterase [Polyangia bacterium]